MRTFIFKTFRVSTLLFSGESELSPRRDIVAKVVKEPFCALYPIPVVLVTCLDKGGRPNVMTVSWAGTVASSPPCLAIGVRPYRYSHAAIEERGEFVVNIPTQELLSAVDYCGRMSLHRTSDKFAETGLTPAPASQVAPPLIAECPANMECQVVHSLDLDSHTLFVGRILAVHVDEGLLDERGFIDYAQTQPIAYLGNEYWSLGQPLATAGFTMLGDDAGSA
jgi:flavin reductase (DIM6/NTAB) family NADH-FMN oxidoreductase RutF